MGEKDPQCFGRKKTIVQKNPSRKILRRVPPTTHPPRCENLIGRGPNIWPFSITPLFVTMQAALVQPYLHVAHNNTCLSKHFPSSAIQNKTNYFGSTSTQRCSNVMLKCWNVLSSAWDHENKGAQWRFMCSRIAESTLTQPKCHVSCKNSVGFKLIIIFFQLFL